MIRTKIIYTLFIFLGVYGCSLEHHVHIRMHEDKYTIDYEQYRDVDFIPFLYPSELHSWTRVDSGESDLQFTREFRYSEQPASLFTLDQPNQMSDIIEDSFLKKIKNIDLVLKEPYKVKRKSYFIAESYEFELIFKNRRIRNNYDMLVNYYSGFLDDAQSIIDGGDVDNRVNNEMLLIFNQLINFFYMEALIDVEWNQRNIYLNGLSGWKEDPKINELINEKKIGLDGEQLNKILDASKEYLDRVVDPSYIEKIDRVWSDLKLEVYTSLFLMFNEFNINIDLPEYNTLSHNADSTYSNRLIYGVSVDNFMDSDYRIYAQATKINIVKLILTLASVFVLWAFFRKKYSKN